MIWVYNILRKQLTIVVDLGKKESQYKKKPKNKTNINQNLSTVRKSVTILKFTEEECLKATSSSQNPFTPYLNHQKVRPLPITATTSSNGLKLVPRTVVTTVTLTVLVHRPTKPSA